MWDIRGRCVMDISAQCKSRVLHDRYHHAGRATAPRTAFLTRWDVDRRRRDLLIIGVLQVLLSFTLPACSDKRATDTLHTIFSQQKITINKISDYKLVSEGELIAPVRPWSTRPARSPTSPTASSGKAGP